MTLNEYFNMLLELEKEHMNNDCDFTKEFVVKIVECVLENFLELIGGELECHDDGKISELQKSSVFLISLINVRHLNVTLQYLFKFLQHYIESGRIDQKVAALSVLESIVFVPGQEKVSEIIDQVFFGVLTYFQNPEIHVRMTAASVLRVIGEKYPRKLAEESKYSALMPIVLACLDSRDLEPFFYMMVFKMIEAWYGQMEVFNGAEREIMLRENRLLTLKLLEMGENSNILFIINGAFCASMGLFGKVTPKEDYTEWFKMLWTMFNRLEKRFTTNEDFMRLDGLFINLNVILQNMTLKESGFNSQNIEEDFANTCFNRILNLFNQSQQILAEGILVLTSLIELEPEKLKPQIANYVENILGFTIAKKDEKEMFSASIHSIGAITKKYQSSMNSFVVKVVPLFLEQLQNSETDRSTRVNLFMALSDICAHAPESIVRQMRELIRILEMAFSATISLLTSNNSDDRQYGVRLRDALVEIIMCIVHGIIIQPKYFEEKQLVENFQPQINDFLKMTSQPSKEANLEYLCMVLMLLIDLNSSNELLEHWDQRFADYLINQLKKWPGDLRVQETFEQFREFEKMMMENAPAEVSYKLTGAFRGQRGFDMY